MRETKDVIEKTVEKLDSKVGSASVRDSLDRQTEKKLDSEALKEIKKLVQKESDFYDKHGYYSFWSDNLKAQKIKGSGGEKARSLKIRTAGRGKASLNESGGDVGSNPTENSKLPECSKCETLCRDIEDCLEMEHFTPKKKLPEPICPFCGRKLIRYKDVWICGHGCTKPAIKPKEAEPDSEYDNILIIQSMLNREHLLIEQHKKDIRKLIEGFIKFIDHFEERYEGNKCGECLEYWKTIKKHYKGV